MTLQEVSTIQPADEALVAELERLLAEAKEGRARAILYVISRSGGEPMRWGSNTPTMSVWRQWNMTRVVGVVRARIFSR